MKTWQKIALGLASLPLLYSCSKSDKTVLDEPIIREDLSEKTILNSNDFDAYVDSLSESYTNYDADRFSNVLENILEDTTDIDYKGKISLLVRKAEEDKRFLYSAAYGCYNFGLKANNISSLQLARDIFDDAHGFYDIRGDKGDGKNVVSAVNSVNISYLILNSYLGAAEDGDSLAYSKVESAWDDLGNGLKKYNLLFSYNNIWGDISFGNENLSRINNRMNDLKVKYGGENE
ncbi:MAG: hypothetical protein KJ674_00630 [Nanoarchaeota archaeon]|nr:hypothetical protein [Nanoarchaeota archaeon]